MVNEYLDGTVCRRTRTRLVKNNIWWVFFRQKREVELFGEHGRFLTEVYMRHIRAVHLRKYFQCCMLYSTIVLWRFKGNFLLSRTVLRSHTFVKNFSERKVPDFQSCCRLSDLTHPKTKGFNFSVIRKSVNDDI